MADDDFVANDSDLGVRTLSAIVMLAVAGGALWFGGFVWFALVVAAGFAVVFEFGKLVGDAGFKSAPRAAWAAFALIYVGIACWALIYVRSLELGLGIRAALFLIGIVIATDIGAYFAGRMIGGPKIAPKISPSKTWAGLFGGMILAGLYAYLFVRIALEGLPFVQDYLVQIVMLATSFAILAQCGDFLESWLKRRAGAKDSGNLIPGHGGVFDRVVGLLAVMFISGLTLIYFMVTGSI